MVKPESMQAALIGWFESHKENLPWRQNRDPYRIWLSEIMLQQTQVSTVIPYFNRFIDEFPDIFTLAAAPLDRVLKAWEGLGYYGRARQLHRAAQLMVEQDAGHIPSSVSDLMKLPGIGRYTAGAIASLAYGAAAPVLDGNVIRVLTRLFDLSEDIAKAATRAALWRRAEELLPAHTAGAWNEGLMELGRRVCTPRQPQCGDCPLNEHCLARRKGVEEERPVRSPHKRKPHYEVAAGVIRRRDGCVLIAQRLPQGMLGGLWEFPGGKREGGETLVNCLRREVAEELGVEVEVEQQIAIVKHAYTHFRITLYAFACRYVSGEPQTLGCAAWAWVKADEFGQYAFPATDRKIILGLQNGSQLGLGIG